MVIHEFRIKRSAVYVFMCTSFFYLASSLIKGGKSSLPIWLQCSTLGLYCMMSLASKIFDKELGHIKMLNRIIPVFVLSMYIPTLTMTSMEAYDSEVVWAFCLSLVFTLMQICSLLFMLPTFQQIFITILALVCMISNIERQSNWKMAVRIEIYPYILFCTIACNIIHNQLYSQKDKLIFELRRKNNDLVEAQKQIMNSMHQGIILLEENDSVRKNRLILQKN